MNRSEAPIMMARLLAVMFWLIAMAFPALAEKRVALVIGNSNYLKAAELKNPVNDATDIAAKLKTLGFDVVSGTDLDHRQLLETVKQFSASIEGADVALFFYAGHAVQVDGVNYIAPTDTDISRESDLDFETISLELIRRQMERSATTSIVLLDACRDNPLTRRLAQRTRSTSSSKGLARLEPAAEGTFIAFATQPDNVALDGNGRNSPFTSALLKNIDREGLEISAMMTDVRREVYQETDQQQLPWTNSSLLGFFYFNPKKEKSADSTAADDARTEALQQLQQEAADWDAAEKSESPDAVREFISKYPDGIYTRLAKFTLDRLTAEPDTKEAGQQVASLETPTRQAEDKETGEALQVAEKDTEAEKQLVRSIQGELNRIGCDAGKADGIWGRKSEQAVSRFAKHGGVDLASLDPDEELHKKLQENKGRICPLLCSPREVEKNGKCVAKTCESGFRLNSVGDCVSAPVAAKKVPVEKRSSPTKRATSGTKSSANCFKFNGQLICD
ncbi:MAG: caspase family protein [Nitratireductor sp.]